jgi:hypothetical protein
MRRLLAVLVAVLLFTGCKTTRKVPHPHERLVRGPAVLVKHPVARDRKIDDQREGNFEEMRRRNFILPRAWPATEIDPNKRLRAYEELRALRASRGLRHITTQWGAAGPGGGPGGGGPGGGPGAPGGMDAGGCAWTTAGPTNINGRVTNIAIDPTNRDRIFITTVGGIWRSTNRGRTWQRVSDDFLSTVFASVAINPDNPAEVFAGGGDPNYHGAGGANGIGIWRSTAGGDPGSWSKVSPAELDNQVIYRLRIDPDGSNDIYAATSAGVYVGTHSGATVNWSRLGSFDSWANDIAVDFSSTPRKVYAGVRSDGPTFERGIWKWDGSAWNRRDTGVPMTASRTINLALAQSDPETLYAKVEANTGHLQGVYKTMNGGTDWSALPAASVLDDSGFGNFWYSWYNSIIEVDPSNRDIVYAGGLSLFRTTTGGTSWEDVSGGADEDWPQWIHSDQHAVAFDPVNPKLVYSGNDGGIDRTSDTTMATWHWNDLSHGLIVTEFYRMTTQLETATLVAGGSQDNGTEISFGNRTWYNPGGCDGADVGVDSADSATLYANCNGGLYELANPVPGTPGGLSTITWVSPAGLGPAPPVVTNPTTPAGGALAAAGGGCNPVQILKTTDGVNWTSIATLPAGARVRFITAAPGTSFNRFYVGMDYAAPSLTDCPSFSGTPFTPTVWRTTAGGAPWSTTSAGVPNGSLMNAVADPADPNRAFLLAGEAGVALTTDGGASWIPVTGTLPSGTFVVDGAIDPSDPGTFYLATNIGVFRGVITAGGGTASAVWTPFDEGLPDGLNVTDMSVNPATHVLTISSFGHAAYHRDITPGITCPARMLVVRDNVFDRGVQPSPSSVADPEHPIPDAARPGFYKPDDTPGGQLYWWTSSDIRIDVPDADPPKNQIAVVDHVEFESCPVELAECPVGTLLDSQARRGRAARGYVQVSNRGLSTISNVRVIALYTDATAGLPLLPANFWSTTFPATGPCGALDTSTGWHLVDTASPCKTIPAVGPNMPEVARFDWSVPMDAAEHSCFLTIVEAVDDPINPAVRSANERRLWILVPQNRQIGLRNLHVVDPPPLPMPGPFEWAEVVLIPNPGPDPFIDLAFSAVGIEDEVRVILPTTVGVQADRMRRSQFDLTKKELELVRASKLDPAAVFTLPGRTGFMRVPVPPGQTWRIALSTRTDQPARVSVVAMQGSTVLGGSTYVLRAKRK